MVKAGPEIAQDEALALVARAQARLEEATRIRVARIREARELGLSWEQIGQALGMTGEGARKLIARAETRSP